MVLGITHYYKRLKFYDKIIFRSVCILFCYPLEPYLLKLAKTDYPSIGLSSSNPSCINNRGMDKTVSLYISPIWPSPIQPSIQSNSTMWLKIALKDWSTSEPYISVIFRRNSMEITARCSLGLPQQIYKSKCKLICANVLFLTVLQPANNTVSIGKMTGAQQCVLRQYTIQVHKLIYFDRFHTYLKSPLEHFLRWF